MDGPQAGLATENDEVCGSIRSGREQAWSAVNARMIPALFRTDKQVKVKTLPNINIW